MLEYRELVRWRRGTTIPRLAVQHGALAAGERALIDAILEQFRSADPSLRLLEDVAASGRPHQMRGRWTVTDAGRDNEPRWYSLDKSSDGSDPTGESTCLRVAAADMDAALAAALRLGGYALLSIEPHDRRSPPGILCGAAHLPAPFWHRTTHA